MKKSSFTKSKGDGPKKDPVSFSPEPQIQYIPSSTYDNEKIFFLQKEMEDWRTKAKFYRERHERVFSENLDLTLQLTDKENEKESWKEDCLLKDKHINHLECQLQLCEDECRALIQKLNLKCEEHERMKLNLQKYLTESAAPSSLLTESAAPSFPLTESAAPSFPLTESAAPSFPLTESAAPSFPLTESAAPSSLLTESAGPSSLLTESAGPSSLLTESAGPSSAADQQRNPGYNNRLKPLVRSKSKIPIPIARIPRAD